MLEKINSAADLKKLKLAELTQLAQETRNLILEVTSQKGGHLASSLGAVEICIALHYCLNTPFDTVIFDVGHQAYAHKIITGRRDAFKSLREAEGLCGFPSPKESMHDPYHSGHASTAVSWAQGIAEAKRLRKIDSKSIAVIGDGSLTGGMCFEALNACGHSRSDVLVIFNHNEMSISQSVGALSNYLNKIISAPVYNRLKNELEEFLRHFALVKRLGPKARKFEEALKGLVVPGIFFEELGFRYFGPIDGNDLDVLIPTLTNVIPLKGPRLLHVITKKGKGYSFAEKNPEDFHSVSAFDIATGTPRKPKQESFSETFAHALAQLAQKDKKIVAITAAMPQGTGLDIFQKKYPERFFDMGIAEEHAVGFASGLAKGGLKPVVAIYSTFLQRGFDQIVHDVALQNLPVVFAIDRAGLVGEDGPTHHGVFDVGYLRLIPNMVCMAPKDKPELERMLDLALSLGCPVSIRYPKDNSFSLDDNADIRLGRGQVICEGDDICIVALGSMVKTGLECVSLLKKEGIKAGLINARFIKPLDKELLTRVAREYGTVITLEESGLAAGFGSAVLELYEEEGLLEKTKLVRAGIPDDFILHAKRDKLLEMLGLNATALTQRIHAIVKEKILWHK